MAEFARMPRYECRICGRHGTDKTNWSLGAHLDYHALKLAAPNERQPLVFSILKVVRL